MSTSSYWNFGAMDEDGVTRLFMRPQSMRFVSVINGKEIRSQSGEGNAGIRYLTFRHTTRLQG